MTITRAKNKIQALVMTATVLGSSANLSQVSAEELSAGTESSVQSEIKQISQDEITTSDGSFNHVGEVKQLDVTQIKEKQEEIDTENTSVEDLKNKENELNSKVEELKNKVTEIESQENKLKEDKQIQVQVHAEQEKKVEEKKTELVQKTDEVKKEAESSIVAPVANVIASSFNIGSTVDEVVTNNDEIEKLTKQAEKEEKTLNNKKEEVKSSVVQLNHVSETKKEAQVQLESTEQQKNKISEAIKQKEEQELQRLQDDLNKNAEAETRANYSNINSATASSNVNYGSVAPSGTSPVVANNLNWLDSSYMKDSDYALPTETTLYTGYSGNAYAIGQCTWYVYNRMAQLGKTIDPYFGNGGDWNDTAIAKGYTVTSTPTSGAAVVFEGWVPGSAPGYGHVAFVEHVYEDGSFLISEMNVGGVFQMGYRIITPSEGISFVIPK